MQVLKYTFAEIFTELYLSIYFELYTTQWVEPLLTSLSSKQILLDLTMFRKSKTFVVVFIQQEFYPKYALWYINITKYRENNNLFI